MANFENPYFVGPHNQTYCMDQDQFGPLMEKAYRDALDAADAIKAVASADREAAQKELDAAKAAREAIEADTEKVVEAYFAERRAQLITFTQKELLRQLALKHLESGKKAEDIAHWLDVPLDFVTKIEAVKLRLWNPFAKKTGLQKLAETLGNARLLYSTQGRGGTVFFESNETKFDMWWEFGGGDALAIVDIPSEQHWVARTKLPLERRTDVLDYIAQQVIQDQASGRGTYEISDNYLTIYQ